MYSSTIEPNFFNIAFALIILACLFISTLKNWYLIKALKIYLKKNNQYEYSCAMKSQFREIGNHLSGTGNHLVANNASLLA